MQECRELYESVYLRFKRNGAAPGVGRSLSVVWQGGLI